MTARFLLTGEHVPNLLKVVRFAFIKELQCQMKTIIHKPPINDGFAVNRTTVYIFLFCHVRAPSLRAMTLLLLLIDFRQALQCDLQCRPLQEGSDEDVDSKARGCAGFSSL